MMELKLTPEELAKVTRTKGRLENKFKVDPEWFFVAQFGDFYGWDGVMAILNNEIDMEAANLLLVAARKIRARNIVDKAIATQVAYSSAHSKNPKEAFFKGMKQFTNEAKL